MAAPLQLPFIFMIRYHTGKAIITPAFLLTYYVCCTVQVALMLYLGYMLVHLLWKFGFNPDNNSIPILTALADLMGSALFAMGFLFLYSIQDPNAFNDEIPLPWHPHNNATMLNATLLNPPMLNTSFATMSSTLAPLADLGTFVGNLTNFTSVPDATTTIASTLATFLANSTRSP